MDIYNKSVDNGYPTAVTGEEWGIKRRFEFLRRYTSLRGKTVLDLGCGVGAYSRFALQSGADLVVGVDMNSRFLIRANSLQRVRSTIDSLSIVDSKFDAVFLIEVLDHLDDEEKTLREAKRVLKKGGLIFITVPNRFFLFETHGLKLGKTNINNIFGLGIPFLSWMPSILRKRVENARIYTQKSMYQMLSKQGFEVLKIGYMMPPLDMKFGNKKVVDAFRKILIKTECTLFRYFGCHVLLLARAT